MFENEIFVCFALDFFFRSISLLTISVYVLCESQLHVYIMFKKIEVQLKDRVNMSCANAIEKLNTVFVG